MNISKSDMLDGDASKQPARKYNMFYDTPDGIHAFKLTSTLRRPVLQMRRLVLAVEQIQIALGGRFLPSLKRLADSLYLFHVRARYQAAIERGFVLALLMIGVTIWLS